MTRIISDSACGLPEALLVKYQIIVLPSQFANVEQSGRVSRSKVKNLPLDQTIQCLRAFQDEDQELVCITTSQELSDAIQVLNFAVADLQIEDRVRVVDSQNIAAGMGLLLIHAADMALHGCHAEEIEAAMIALRRHIRFSFIGDDMSKRPHENPVNKLVARFDAAIGLHPLVSVKNGKLIHGLKYYGGMEQAVDLFTEDLKENLLTASEKRVFVAHTGCSRNLFADVYASLQGLHRFQEIIVGDMRDTVPICGEMGAIGIAFIDGQQ